MFLNLVAFFRSFGTNVWSDYCIKGSPSTTCTQIYSLRALFCSSSTSVTTVQGIFVFKWKMECVNNAYFEIYIWNQPVFLTIFSNVWKSSNAKLKRIERSIFFQFLNNSTAKTITVKIFSAKMAEMVV